jgi:hypothetical protein
MSMRHAWSTRQATSGMLHTLKPAATTHIWSLTLMSAQTTMALQWLGASTTRKVRIEEFLKNHLCIAMFLLMQRCNHALTVFRGTRIQRVPSCMYITDKGQ